MAASALVIDEFSRNPQEKEKTLVRSASDGKLDETPRPLDDFFDVDFPERECNSSDERWIMDLLGMALDLQSPPHLKKSVISMVKYNARLFPDFRYRYFYKIGSTSKSKCIENPCDFLIPPSPDPPTGIYVRYVWWRRYPFQPPDFDGCYEMLLFENENNKTPETLLLFDPAVTPDVALYIFDSCNGVLLCEDDCCTKFYLYNPTVDAYTTLPWPKTLANNPYILVVDMVIVLDPNFHHYQIVVLLKITSSESKSLISVYSTRNGVWKDFCGSSLLILTDGRGVSCNHAVYWLSGLSEKVVCFDLDQERLHFIDRPFTDKKPKTHVRFHDFLAKSHQGTLLCGVFSSSMTALVIWELEDGSWCIRYLVDLGKACGLRSLEEIPSIDQRRYRQVPCFDVLYFLDCAEYEDTFLVFRAYGKAIRYHVASGRSYQLGDVLPDSICLHRCCFPF